MFASPGLGFQALLLQLLVCDGSRRWQEAYDCYVTLGRTKECLPKDLLT